MRRGDGERRWGEDREGMRMAREWRGGGGDGAGRTYSNEV